MNVRTWLAILALLIGICGCGRGDLDSSLPISSNPPMEFSPGMTTVVGSAQFGSQCPYGSFSAPHEVPLELWSCPIGLPSVELVEPLQPLVLQADCKKKTLDIRGITPHSGAANTWEVMPDGSFYLIIDAGMAKLKNDGSGTLNCATPLTGNLWGKIDCTDRDKAKIHVETVWWLGQPYQSVIAPFPYPSRTPYPGSSSTPTSTSTPDSTPTPTLSPSPSLSPIPSPSPSPSLPLRRSEVSWALSPESLPSSVPSMVPITTLPSSVPSPLPVIHPSATPSGMPSTPSAGGSSALPECKLPRGCYFHNITHINQCS